MNEPEEPVPPQHVPTLTEVVEWPQPLQPVVGAAPALSAASAAPSPSPLPSLSSSSSSGSLGETVPSEAQLVQRVLADLQRQTDLMLDYRLREVLTPLLARATDNLIREARGELALTLRDMVTRAVAQEMARHRGG